MSKFITDKLTVNFAYLNKPDDKFGADTANFNVTVAMSESLQEQIKTAVKSTGAKKVNGVWENDKGEKLIKFKNRIMVRDGLQAFPCVDSQNNATRQTASGGDVVRLLLAPALIKRDNSLSIYLDGVQIIEKNSNFGGGGVGFDAVDGGWSDNGQAFPDAEEATAPITDDEDVVAADDDDLPF